MPSNGKRLRKAHSNNNNGRRCHHDYSLFLVLVIIMRVRFVIWWFERIVLTIFVEIVWQSNNPSQQKTATSQFYNLTDNQFSWKSNEWKKTHFFFWKLSLKTIHAKSCLFSTSVNSLMSESRHIHDKRKPATRRKKQSNHYKSINWYDWQ